MKTRCEHCGSYDLSVERDWPEDGVTSYTCDGCGAEWTVNSNRDPELVRGELDELLAEKAKIDQPSAELATTRKSPAEMKRAMAEARASAIKLQEKVTHKSEELEKALKARVNEMERMARAEMQRIKSELEPMQQMVEQMNEGIWTINLYLGRDEEMHLLRKGQPAPKDTPISVRQLVLAMDQECAYAAEDGGLTEQNVESFDEWLLEDPAHVDQVLPEEKGVVVLVPSWTAKQDEDSKPWVIDESEKVYDAAGMAKVERQAYFLVRNGEMLLRTWTDFNAGPRLIPSAEEFSDFFKVERDRYSDSAVEPDVEYIKPGTPEWAAAEEKADAKKRHYMRVALILQGLVDRTTVLRPLPDAGVNFLDRREHETGKVRFILDADNLLTEGREDYPTWHKRLMGQLETGMRIVGAFGSFKFHSQKIKQEKQGGYSREISSRIRPSFGAHPPSGVPLVVRRTSPSVFRASFPYESEEAVGRGPDRHWEMVEKTGSVEIHDNDKWVLPFDLADVEDMERFLASRLDRRHYLDMMPLLKVAIHLKSEELKAEKPFRDLLITQMAKQKDGSQDTAEQMVDDLIFWYKTRNRTHVALLEDDTKAFKSIVAEYGRRVRGVGSNAPDEAMIKTLRAAHRNAICIHRTKSNRYVAVVLQEKGNPYCDEIEYNRHGEQRAENQDRLIGIRHKRWEILWKDEAAWAAYDFKATKSSHLASHEIQERVEDLLDTIPREKWAVRRYGNYNKGWKDHPVQPERQILAITFEPDPDDHLFRVWTVEEHLPDERVDPDEYDLEEMAEPAEFKYKLYDAHWHRRRDGDLDWEYRDSLGYTTGIHGSTIEVRSGERPWENPKMGYNRRYVNEVLWTANDFSILKKVDKRLAEIEAAKAADEAFHARVRDWCDTIPKAWESREEQKQYARFIEDYQDPELWEGHRKLIADTLRFPHRWILESTRGYRRSVGPLYKLVTLALEKGVELEDMKVADLVAELKFDPADHKDHYGDAMKPLPDDVLDLKFSTPEEDDDD